MTNDVMVPDGVQLPAYLQDQQNVNNDALVTSGVSMPRISLRGKQFRFKMGDQERALPLGHPLAVVILGATPRKGCAKAWYDTPYDGGDEPPSCSSSDGVAPDSWVINPVHNVCATCPKNAFGSGTDQNGNPTKGKACADVKRLLVIAGDKPDMDICALQVPPTSLKMLSQYAQKLTQYNIPVHTVITELSFTEAEYPQLKFRHVGFIDEAHAPKIISRVNSEEVQNLIDGVHSQPAAETAVTNDEILKDPPAFVKDEEEKSAQETKPETEPAKTFEKAVKLEDGSYAVDNAGTMFSSKHHVKARGKQGGSLDDAGLFKKKKSAETKSEPKQEKKEASESLFDQEAKANDEEASQTESSDDAGDDNAALQAVMDDWFKQ